MSVLVEFEKLTLSIPKGSKISKQNGIDTEPCVYLVMGDVNFKVVCGAEGYRKTVNEDMSWIPIRGIKVGINCHQVPLAHAMLYTRPHWLFWKRTCCITFTYKGCDYLLFASSKKENDLAHLVRSATVSSLGGEK